MFSHSDLFKLGLCGAGLLAVAFAEGKIDGPGGSASPSPVERYAWVEQSNAQFKRPQDSPWLWLEEKPKAQAQQVSQNQKQDEQPVDNQQQQPLPRPVKEDRPYNETTPADRIRMMDDMRQFRLQQQEDMPDPVRL